MLVAIFASSCNKYADDFKQLNTKLDALATSVAGVAQLSKDLADARAQISALAASLSALPQTASITALATTLAGLGTKVDGITTTLAGVATTGTANATAIAGVKADLAALVASQAKANADATANFAKSLAAVAAVDTKVAAVATQLTAIAAQETALATAQTALAASVAAGQTANVAAFAANAAKLAELKTQSDALVASMGTMSAANTAGFKANADAFAAEVLAGNAIAAQATAILAALATAKTTEDATKLVVDALTTSLAAAKTVIDQINNNTIKTVTVVAITGVAQQGVVLTAAADAGATVTYEWKSATTAGGTYTAIAGATASTYTPVLADVAKFLKVTVLGTGSWAGAGVAITSAATAAVGPLVAITSVTIASATAGVYRVGAAYKLTATPSNASVTYQWVSSATQYGTYLPIAAATAATYTPVTADIATYINVVATGTGGYFNTVTATTPVLIAISDSPVSAGFLMVPANNTVTITLTGGTFSTAVAKAYFTFLGEDATVIGNGTLTYVSSTVVKFTTSTSFNASSTNTVTVAAAGMLTQATSVAAVGSTEVMLTPVGSAITGLVAPVAGASPVLTVSGTGFTGTVSWSPSIATGGKFLPAQVYTATVSLSASSNYTFSGVLANSWTGTLGTVTNTANSSSLSVVYPSTSSMALPTANGELSIAQFPLPVTGVTAITAITGTNYTGVVTWSPALAGGKFQSGYIYTATIAIVPNVGYTSTGCVAPFWTTIVTGTTVVYVTSATSLTVACPITLQ